MSAVDNETAAPSTKTKFNWWVIAPNAITTVALFCAYFSVIESLKAFHALSIGQTQASSQHFDLAAMAILWGFLFDNLDGRVARMVKVTSEFGKEFDSLADVLTFGLAPMVLIYCWCYSALVDQQIPLLTSTFIFLLCGALRLARFNVQSHKPEKDAEQPLVEYTSKFFVGMPIPIAAIVLAAIVHFSPAPVSLNGELIASLGLNLSSASIVMLVLVVTLGALMVSTVPYYTFKGLGQQFGAGGSAIMPLAVLAVIASGSQWAILASTVFLCLMGPAVAIWRTLPLQKKQAHHEHRL